MRRTGPRLLQQLQLVRWFRRLFQAAQHRHMHGGRNWQQLVIPTLKSDFRLRFEEEAQRTAATDAASAAQAAS